MADQLELTTNEDETPAVTVPIPGHLWKRIGRLEPSARQELEQRIGTAIEQAYEALAAVRSLTSEQLVERAAMARRELERLSEEIDRRATASPGQEPAAVAPPHA